MSMLYYALTPQMPKEGERRENKQILLLGQGKRLWLCDVVGKDASATESSFSQENGIRPFAALFHFPGIKIYMHTQVWP